ncbi:MAG: helix-turn-helix domain-containing protein [Acidobacteriota bacterium]|nr:helix-turn-helix domain-containing protein [Acidobacteriota bacterium]
MKKTEGSQIIEILQSAIQFSKLTYRDVERQLGWSVGTMTRLMRGGLEFKLKHLIAISQVIKFSPSRLFAVAFPYQAGDDPDQEWLQRLLEQMHSERRTAPSPRRGPLLPPASRKIGVSQDEIDTMVRESLEGMVGPIRSEAPGREIPPSDDEDE